MKESSLTRLINFRKEAYSLAELSKQPQSQQKDEEIASLHKQNKKLANKIKNTEDILSKNINANRFELEIREKEILKLQKELKNKDQEKTEMQAEITNLRNVLNSILMEKEEILNLHAKEIQDLKLKHDQELYILRKMKKNSQ